MASPHKIPKPEYKYQPIVRDGIPHMVKDSNEYNNFWAEEKRRCIEGYKPPDGVWIPGTYYHRLNHLPMSRLRYDFDRKGTSKMIVALPLYRDGNHFIHDAVAKRRALNRGGMIILKGRQKGITDDMISIVDNTMRFFLSVQASYATPDPDQLQNFYVKFKLASDNINDAFAEPFKVDNVDQKQMGLDVPTPFGKKTMGSESILYTSAIPKSAVFKSKNFVLSVTDEIGMFGKGKKDKNLNKGSAAVTLSQYWGDTVDCWKRGDMWYGFPIFLGTVDQINYAKNDDLEKFWRNAETYDLERCLLPADYMYGDHIDLVTGKSDRESARTAIYAQRKKLQQLPDKTDYYKAIQNNPLNEDELFLLTMNSFVNTARINEQIIRVNNNRKMQERCKPGILEWERESIKDQYVYTGRVIFTEKQGGLWRLNLLPINETYPDADIMFIDDYFKDEAPESDSLGGICVLRRFINLNEVAMIPSMTYLGRPNTLAQFHDECLKGAVFTKSRAAVEYHNDLLKDFFLKSTKVDGRRFLKVFPRVSGQGVKERDAFGYVIKENEKEKEKELIKAWVEEPYIENCNDIRFLKAIAVFGKQNSDLGSAFGGALLYNEDMPPVLRATEDHEKLIRVGYEMQATGIPIQIRRGIEPANKFKKLAWMQTLNR